MIYIYFMVIWVNGSQNNFSKKDLTLHRNQFHLSLNLILSNNYTVEKKIITIPFPFWIWNQLTHQLQDVDDVDQIVVFFIKPTGNGSCRSETANIATSPPCHEFAGPGDGRLETQVSPELAESLGSKLASWLQSRSHGGSADGLSPQRKRRWGRTKRIWLLPANFSSDNTFPEQDKGRERA